MRRLLFAIVAALALVAAPVHAALTLAPADKMVMFGDSISTGSGWWGPYITQVNAAYTRAGTTFVTRAGAVTTTAGAVTVSSAGAASNFSPTVIGKGVVGNKVSDLQARVAADVIALSPTVVIIEAGVNDLILATPTGTLATNAANLLSTIKASLPTVRLAWVGILCYGEYYPDTTWNANINTYNGVLQTAIEAAGGTYINVRAPQQAYEAIYNVPPPGAISGLLTSDAVHPNATGNQLMSDTAWAASTITGAPTASYEAAPVTTEWAILDDWPVDSLRDLYGSYILDRSTGPVGRLVVSTTPPAPWASPPVSMVMQ